MKLYKFTRADGEPCSGGSGEWSLPRGRQSGAWRTVTGDLEPCENGLHLCRPAERKWQHALLARALKSPAFLEKLPKELEA